MHKDYLSKLLQLEGYIIDNIDFEESRILVNCHPRKRGMWYKDEYSEVLSASRVKTARHMIMENRVVVLEIAQRKFFSGSTGRDYGRNCPALSRASMILSCSEKTAS